MVLKSKYGTFAVVVEQRDNEGCDKIECKEKETTRNSGGGNR